MAKRLAQHAAALSENRESTVAVLRVDEPAATGRSDEDLVSFLLACNMDIHKAAAKLRAAASTLASYGSITIADVADFYRAPSPDRVLPDGCIFLLEDSQGGVARDVLGRPVMVSIGIQHGSVEEMRKQYLYASQRAMAHALPGLPPNAVCTVIDVQPQEKGAPTTFRFPDKTVRSIFDLQETCFPGALFSSTHFCGLPMFVTWAFRLVKPFMRREAYEAMNLKPSFAHLPHKHLAPEAMLPRWGGTFEFDLDAYVEWRAREEGVDMATVCPRGAGRAFDAAAAAASQAAALAAASGDGADGGGAADADSSGAISAPELVAAGGVLMQGVVRKRGSGRGLFSTVRWKPKLLVLSPNGLAYFDGTDAQDSANKLARLVPLGALGSDARVARVGGKERDARGPPSQWRVEAAGRDFLFAVDDPAQADAWVEAIGQAIDGSATAASVASEASGERAAGSPSAVATKAAPLVVAASDVTISASEVTISPTRGGRAADDDDGVAAVRAVMRLTPSQVEVIEPGERS